MKNTSPAWRGLTVQVLAITVLPLTLLLLAIAFGSISLHQQDMRALVGERDERAVQAAAAALISELHHRASSVSHLAQLAGSSGDSIAPSEDILADFDGGIAYFDVNGQLMTTSSASRQWAQMVEDPISLASPSEEQPVFSAPIFDPVTQKHFVIVSKGIPGRNISVAGAFSPQNIAVETLSASYAENTHITIYLLDSSGQVLFAKGQMAAEHISVEHPGVAEALRGESGTTYTKQGDAEHVVAYSAIPPTGWALITQEEWEMVTSPSLQATQMAPLVIVPAFILALVALWFVASRIVQPLQTLEAKAAALAWGDFETIKEPVGGISEVRHLQMELIEMARKVQAAQEGLHDYIAAITSAQEEERNRLARELHDDTIQAVIALKQRVQLARASVRDQGANQTLEQLESLAEQTIENLRRLTRALRPIYLEDLGLVTALEMLARETSQANGLVVGFQKEGSERRLPREKELSLYRIAQEALNNVVKHANATQAELRIEFGEAQMRMEVTDNGIGFHMPKSPTDFAPNGHFGLLGIRERADLIGARLEVESTLGKGTRLTVWL